MLAKAWEYSPKDRFLHCLPLHHILYNMQMSPELKLLRCQTLAGHLESLSSSSKLVVLVIQTMSYLFYGAFVSNVYDRNLSIYLTPHFQSDP
jgi:hypothetical protein